MIEFHSHLHIFTAHEIRVCNVEEKEKEHERDHVNIHASANATVREHLSFLLLLLLLSLPTKSSSPLWVTIGVASCVAWRGGKFGSTRLDSKVVGKRRGADAIGQYRTGQEGLT